MEKEMTDGVEKQDLILSESEQLKSHMDEFDRRQEEVLRKRDKVDQLLKEIHEASDRASELQTVIKQLIAEKFGEI
jgi:hypothetical protein